MNPIFNLILARATKMSGSGRRKFNTTEAGRPMIFNSDFLLSWIRMRMVFQIATKISLVL